MTRLNRRLMAAGDMQANFEAAGYKLPQVVYWNLRASSIRGQKSTPVTFNQEGVALVSGFSGQLLKLFMDHPNDLTSWEVGHCDDAPPSPRLACFDAAA